MKVTKTFSFNKYKDKDILEYLDNYVNNQSEYIRNLIRMDIMKEDGESRLIQIKKIIDDALSEKGIKKQYPQQQELKLDDNKNSNNLDVVDVGQIRKLIDL